MEDFVAQRLDLFCRQLFVAGDVFVSGRVLGDEGAFSDGFAVGLQVFYATEFVNVAEQVSPWDADEGVLDSVESGG